MSVTLAKYKLKSCNYHFVVSNYEISDNFFQLFHFPQIFVTQILLIDKRQVSMRPLGASDFLDCTKYDVDFIDSLDYFQHITHKNREKHPLTRDSNPNYLAYVSSTDTLSYRDVL
jgi:hypothetical protein